MEQNLRAETLSLCGNLYASLSLFSPFIEVSVHRKRKLYDTAHHLVLHSVV